MKVFTAIKLHLLRNKDGWLSIERTYNFSVSSNEEDRIICQLTLIGKSLTDWLVPPYPQKD